MNWGQENTDFLQSRYDFAPVAFQVPNYFLISILDLMSHFLV